MLGRRDKQPAVVPAVVRFSTPREVGEHDALADLHKAKGLADRAAAARTQAERLTEDADEALHSARREMRRISER